MANSKHLEIVRQGVCAWNEWRKAKPRILPNLRKAKLAGRDLRNANFNDTNLRRTDLSGTDLSGASFRRADLRRADLSESTLVGADFTSTTLIDVNMEEATLNDCLVYGVSTWNVNLRGARQHRLIVSRRNSPCLTVDNLEIAQFVHLLVNNQGIREVINTIGQRAVLILGRFSPPARKKVLDAIGDKLRQLGFLPIIFDFEGSKDRDFTETIKILAGLSLFVIADITNPRSSPLELQATVPDYKIPFVPILEKGQDPFSMFRDLTIYDWVLKPVITYSTKESIVNGLEKAVVEPALRKRADLERRKAAEVESKSIEEIVRDYSGSSPGN